MKANIFPRAGYVSLKHSGVSIRPAGPMVRRLTTNQEIAGSSPASVNSFCLFAGCHCAPEYPVRCG
ncbi:uncharacterized protein BO72DRAFT_97569 [Aspergillus fijiensis CBS 313.89]|uniref:Uncharacterized protein n=1 Tax=Aspergillus fijiensis CBS 313.89 TaxID=1448319 RepID=A0A8G1RT74_9EURO|nr:uncharacterized protein BO72DRAFT_97569 [Aspergillus fijiensis CBS 313.89]RAK77858.1 hypothetical protein BO72DRAFT_97569 [Aspergillus fijiensis CBS 313.89]